ncbi:MAG: LysR family transcriptional regulator [Lachnospiraceae bacterium]|nr:LysR family transcriptional regulator [Lachnospiraceae bacterium]
MDRKIEAFLTLCRTMNYRKAADELHLTQPAVTKQIKALEAEYHTRLFIYDGRQLHKTDKCLILETYARSMEYNYQEMQLAMQEKERLHLRIGATKSIGDYVIAPSVIQYLRNKDHELTLIVDNTEQLLKHLNDNELDFAILEGRFDKTKYKYALFRNEPFVGIHGKDMEWPDRVERIEDLFGESIIVREKGSGTREIFENNLKSLGYQLSAFSRVIEFSSFYLIKKAVAEGLGISFLYQSVVDGEDGIETFCVEGVQHEHEFQFVCLKNTPAWKYMEGFMQEVLNA